MIGQESASRSLPAVSPGASRRLLGEILKGVSRTFYLTLRALPKDMRKPVGLAYLLARAADTIADTKLLPPERRLEILLAFREQVRGPAKLETLQAIGDALTQEQSIAEERLLLESLPEVLSLLEGLEAEDARLVRSVLATLTYGMESDLITFPPEDSGRVASLETSADLDKYLYHVAGCVGRFWTDMSMAHVPRLRHWDSKRMANLGISYGKALQLTNVLRDLPKDLRAGRCYLPAEQLKAAGIASTDLLDADATQQAWPLLVEGIRTALAHYASAGEYLEAIPWSCFRLRAAALWPMLIGLATLSILAEDARKGAWLQAERPSRVSRKWVYRTVLLSLPLTPSNLAVKAWLGMLRRRVEDAIS